MALPVLEGAVSQVERGWRLDAEGLDIIQPSKLTLPKLRMIATHLLQQTARIYWAWADLFNSIKGEWGDTWTLASELSGYSPEHCQDIARTGKRFPRGTRHNFTLSFSHFHQAISLPEDKALEYLQKAQDNRWPMKKLREEVAAYNLAKMPPARKAAAEAQAETRKKSLTKWYAKCPNCDHQFIPSGKNLVKVNR